MLLGLANRWRFVQREDDHFLAADRADVVMEAYNADVRYGSNQRFELRPRSLQQLGTDLLEQVSALFRRHRFDQLSLGAGQDVGEAYDNQVINEVRMNILGTPAHVFLLELSNARTDSSFNFALRLHKGVLSGAEMRSGFSRSEEHTS